MSRLDFEEQGDDDFFDRLPDPLLHLIFNKLQDAKSLSLSMCVCKRFRILAPQVDSLLLSIPRRSISRPVSKSSSSSFKNFVSKIVIKPLQFFLQKLNPKSKRNAVDFDDKYYSPSEVLKPFDEIKTLLMKLPSPAGEIGDQSNTLLKWRAEYGTQLRSCVLVGGTSLTPIIENPDGKLDEEQRVSEIPQENEGSVGVSIGDDELKLRIVWTISCLIAATARHCLVQQTIKEHKTLEKLVVEDESDQGRLSMNVAEIEEMRKCLEMGEMKWDSLFDRSRVPALKMKMWYVNELELPEHGAVLKGATLVVIRAKDDESVNENTGGGKVGGKGGMADWVMDAFGGMGEGQRNKVFSEAVKKLIKLKRSYTLEMNSF